MLEITFNALSFIVRSLAGFFILLLLFRFYLQLAHASFKHPMAQFTIKLTNFAVLPLRRFIPSLGAYDTATLVLASITALLMHLLLLLMSLWPINFLASSSILGWILLACLTLIQYSLYLFTGALLAQAILSWVNPYNPATPLLLTLTDPLLKPLRRFVAPVAGIDLTPLLMLLIIQILLQFAVDPIQAKLLGYILLG